MSELLQKNYYKIFTGTNETNGFEKIHLGYESSTAEIIFKKDSTTYFHVPFFTNIQILSSSDLIENGAVSGPAPAMADRISKKQTKYGNTTPWGNSTSNNINGTWLCSWLYTGTSDVPVWLDRYYNPGRIAYAQALSGGAYFETYNISNPVFYDTPSTLTLEPGVWYQYFHAGEKTAQKMVKTLAGDNNDRLRLNIENWSENPIDTSIYQNKTTIKDFNSDWSVDLKEPDIIDRNILNFKNTNFIDARVAYNDSYNLENEFTINFWAQSDDWSETPTCQLVGNYNNGGYGIFYNDLKYYPYFVVPETFYGHLLFFNNDGIGYFDKITTVSNNLNLSEFSFSNQVAINGNEEVIVVDTQTNNVYKTNHLGDVLAIPLSSSGTFLRLSGTPKQLLVDGQNGCYVSTTTTRYYFDKNLTFVGLTSIGFNENSNNTIQELSARATGTANQGTYTVYPGSYTTSASGVSAIFAFTFNSFRQLTAINIVDGGKNFKLDDTISISNTPFLPSTPNITARVTGITTDSKLAFNTNGSLVDEPFCIDIKFDNLNQKWAIKRDNLLYCNDIVVSNITNCTNLAIDPEEILWVLYDTNSIAKINTNTKEILTTFTLGFAEEILTKKNISFIYNYDRINKTKTWYCLVYYSSDQTLYQLTLDGDIKQTTLLTDKINTLLSPPTQQDKNNMLFSGLGDFTGYEWKRIFNNILYKNKPQVQFKVAIKNSIRNTPISTQIVSVPVQYFTNKTWHLFTCTLKNKNIKVYLDGVLRDELIFPSNYNLTYNRKNDLYIGSPTGKFENLNNEINTKSLFFDGYFDNLKIYDYALDPKFIDLFAKERFIGQDLTWNLTTAPLQYIEVIDRFFKHKLPGSKSPFFKIKITGMQITDQDTKSTIEASIRAAIENIKPSYAELLAIEWIN